MPLKLYPDEHRAFNPGKRDRYPTEAPDFSTMAQTKSEEKRYYYSVIEEAVLNPQYEGYRGGRVEVFDRLSKEYEKGYASYEARFLIPEKMFAAFRDIFDEEESDLPVFIRWTEPEGVPARPSKKGP